MSLEAFTGETSKSAFPHIPRTAAGAEARRGGCAPDCSILSAWLIPGLTGDGGGGVLEVSLKKEA